MPTKSWRIATTIPRELKLATVDGALYLTSLLVKELSIIKEIPHIIYNVDVNGDYDLTSKVMSYKGKYLLDIQMAGRRDFSLHLTNAKGNEVIIGYDMASDSYYADRIRSGNVGFEKSFARKAVASRIARGERISLKLLVDVASAEAFIDDGLSVLTNIFFPDEPLDQLYIKGIKPLDIQKSPTRVRASLK